MITRPWLAPPAVTWTWNSDVAVSPPPSVTVRVIRAVPVCSRAGVRAMVRLAPLPPSTRAASGTRAALSELAVTISAVATVSASPTVKAVAGRAVFLASTWLLTVPMVGAVLAGLEDSTLIWRLMLRVAAALSVAV